MGVISVGSSLKLKRKEPLRHRAVSLRYHGFLVLYRWTLTCLSWDVRQESIDDLADYTIWYKNHKVRALILYSLLPTVPRHNASFDSRVSCVSATKTWNYLHLPVKLSQSWSTFRCHLKAHCLQSAYLSPLTPARQTDLIRFRRYKNYLLTYLHYYYYYYYLNRTASANIT